MLTLETLVLQPVCLLFGKRQTALSYHATVW